MESTRYAPHDSHCSQVRLRTVGPAQVLRRDYQCERRWRLSPIVDVVRNPGPGGGLILRPYVIQVHEYADGPL